MPDSNSPFPHAERRLLANPPIELIIGQIRFPTLAPLFSNDGYVTFAKAVSQDFPGAAPEQHMEVTIAPEGISERSRNPVWRFEDLKHQMTLTLTPGFLALETKQYRSFTAFRELLLTSWEKLVSCHSVQHRTRVGLRYVDRVSRDKYPDLPSDWMQKIKSSAFPLFEQLPDSPQKSELEHRFQISESLGLTYRAQLVVGGFGEPDGDFFALDLDAYDPIQSSTEGVEDSLNLLKEASHNAFWWTLGELFDLLEPPKEP